VCLLRTTFDAYLVLAICETDVVDDAETRVHVGACTRPHRDCRDSGCPQAAAVWLRGVARRPPVSSGCSSHARARQSDVHRRFAWLTDHESISPHAERLAEALRRHRVAHRQSLGDLSRITGLSKSSLARLEAAEGNPSLETLWRIGRALGLSVGQLIEQPAHTPARILPADEGPIVESSFGMRGRLLQTNHGRHRTEVFELTLPPGARFQGDPHDAGTRELVYCVQGSISCGPANQPLELAAGDTGYFDGTMPHVYAAGPDGGRALLVMSYPPNAA
jgi:transcriptional regulator with XRE-family HTH domain